MAVEDQAAEVIRLRARLDQVLAELAEQRALFIELAGHDAEIGLCRRVVEEHGQREFERGRVAGWLDAVVAEKRVQQELVRALGDRADVEARRWSVRGEQRTRGTFGQSHPADYRGGAK